LLLLRVLSSTYSHQSARALPQKMEACLQSLNTVGACLKSLSKVGACLKSLSTYPLERPSVTPKDALRKYHFEVPPSQPTAQQPVVYLLCQSPKVQILTTSSIRRALPQEHFGFPAAFLLLYCIINTEDLEHQKSVATRDAPRNTILTPALPAKKLYIKTLSRLD